MTFGDTGGVNNQPATFDDTSGVNNQPVAFGDTGGVNNQPVATSGTNSVVSIENLWPFSATKFSVAISLVYKDIYSSVLKTNKI